MASTCRAIDSRARVVNPAGSFAAYDAMSSKSTPTGRYASGSWAEVWSVTMSMGAPIARSWGTRSAALPRTPMERGRRASRASTASWRAWSSESAFTSR